MRTCSSDENEISLALPAHNSRKRLRDTYSAISHMRARPCGTAICMRVELMQAYDFHCELVA